ncbi:MAG: hypothetical protein E6J32_01805 [Chloroflexi bacterium]|nr:MAG: hypothetical protein E6J32_01805 [Chloroflexota bacterium]
MAAGLNDAERRRALFVVNPALPRTGKDFGQRLLELAGELGWEAMVLETSAGLNVEAIGAALARREFQLVLAAGGDGTVAEVMAAAHQGGLPMGIVPLGTANIVARELKLPAAWRAATRRALERFPHTRAVDLVRVNDGYSALAAGIGFDATVMRYTPAGLKYWLGRAAYFLAGAWWRPRAPMFDCTIRADGEELRMTAVGRAPAQGEVCRGQGPRRPMARGRRRRPPRQCLAGTDRSRRRPGCQLIPWALPRSSTRGFRGRCSCRSRASPRSAACCCCFPTGASAGRRSPRRWSASSPCVARCGRASSSQTTGWSFAAPARARSCPGTRSRPWTWSKPVGGPCSPTGSSPGWR